MATSTKEFADADLVHQLGQMIHAAFLPYGVQPPPSGHVQGHPSEPTSTSLCVCGRYTAPQLAHRVDAEAAVLILYAAPGCSDVALVMFLDKARDTRDMYLERLDVAKLALPQGDWRRSTISWNLANGVCWGLLDQLLRRNGLTMPGYRFRSLPDDAKAEILKRLPSGADLARVECTCRDLRRLVSSRNDELWRHMYRHKPLWDVSEPTTYLDDDDDPVEERGRTGLFGAIRDFLRVRWSFPVDVKRSDDGQLSWKDKYLEARNNFHDCWLWSWGQRQKQKDADKTGKNVFGGHHIKAPRNTYDYKDKKGPRGARAIHTPSARYRWRHR
ncbi:hypothetical protein HU200_047965 [Digitaria exilis]|uniref:F-box domain-containing protein n=1 Tax=Digitaria exilis TaxID=1010633 RepID=A0A835ECF8_9POAL|nr:hypothetical protein HU200_047965 [Digitaria exilis]